MPASIEKVSSGGSTTNNKTATIANNVNTNTNVKTETVNLTDASSPDFYVEDFTEYYVQKKGYMVGDETGFNPDGDMTRAQMVQILYAMEGKPSGATANFNDVKSGEWYADAVAWAQSNGIVAGHTDGTFRPNDKITNEQMAAIMKKYAEFKGKDTKTTGSNVAAIDKLDRSDYSKDALEWASENNMFNVESIDKLKPKDTANRYDMAKMLEQFDRAYNNTEIIRLADAYDEVAAKLRYKEGEKYIGEMAPKINNVSNMYTHFDEIFNNSEYGGSQMTASYYFASYGTEESLLNDNSIKGQKTRILNDIIKKYYPDSTFDQRKQIAEAYSNVGCAYMANADAFILQTSQLSNAEEVFKNTMGYELYVQSDDKKSYNVEAVALDLFLYKFKNYDIESTIARAEGSFVSDSLKKDFYKSKGITMTSETASLSTFKDVLEYTNEHPNAVYAFSGDNYEMKKFYRSEYENNSYTFDDDISSQLNGSGTTTTSHAIFVTGITKDNFITSSWGDKYAVPIQTVNKEGENVRSQLVAIDFDFSQVGGKK